MGLIHAEDYSAAGWSQPGAAEPRARRYCEQLEKGGILFFAGTPFALPESDRVFLLQARQSDSAHHKNISYKPARDRINGLTRGSADEEKMRGVMRAYSQSVSEFLDRFLTPYAGRWRLDFASFRPIEEEGRNLPQSKRNDLLHVDAFPTRPSNGNRILRVFTNLNPEQSRVWLTSDPFDALVKKFGDRASFDRTAARARSPWRPLARRMTRLAHAAGLPVVDRTPYDEFMLGFHHYLKHNQDFQQNCPKSKWEFPPGSTWLVFTDLVPHAVLTGRFALEQTFFISRDAMLLPEKAPYRVLEERAGVPVVD
ncbi:MAG: Kdo hydroxylase family protein [Terriglobia bacterium]